MFQASDKKILQRFKNGLAGKAEDEYICSLFAENENNDQFKAYIYQEFNEFLEEQPGREYNLSYLLDRIYRQIHKHEQKKKDTIVRRMYHWYALTAAILLIPVLITGVILLSEQTQKQAPLPEQFVTSKMYAPLGSRISFSLPDGTNGWLNSGSVLEYTLPFTNNRQIAIQGEAWFNVTHDAEHPFEISAGSSRIKVLGTKFNLSAYPDEKYVEVVLEEGKVEFSPSGVSDGVFMKPNERLVLNNGAIHINTTDAFKYSSWKEGKLVFRGDSMDEVARRIGHWYNVNVELMDKELSHHVIRGTFQDDTLEDVLSFLSMVSPVSYEIIDRKLLENGTVQKKKVLLYKKKI
ncbi:MAG: FecR family protein [Draconibacterium sp.]